MTDKFKPKFSVGDKIKEKGLPEAEGGVVDKIKWDSDVGFTYIFSTKEVDLSTKEIVHGHKVCSESELEVIDEK